MKINAIAPAVALLCLLGVSGCSKKEPEAAKPAAEAAAPPAVKAAEGVPTWTDDLPGLLDKRAIRMLVVYSKTFYFIDKGQQRGITFDFGSELEKALNAANKDKSRPIRIVYIPVSRDKLLPSL